MKICHGDWLHKPERQAGEEKKANLQLFRINDCVTQTASSWKQMSIKKSTEYKINVF